ncbi:hypothetical protein LWE69_11680 [Paenibacillus sp. UKAQ_18]|nr:hypothetical protein [Paenibacillus sp. UKAQ_18]
MAGKGWIKLHRKIRDSSIFNDMQLFRLWTICLTEATHKERDQIVGKQTVHLMPGEFVTGRFQIQELYNYGLKKDDQQKGDKTVYRWLEMLETSGFLTIKKTNKYSVVTIDNWGIYQGDDQNNDQQIVHQMTNKRPSNDHQMTTNKNVKNIENVKNDKKKDSIPKIKFAEFVKLTQQEYDKLVLAHGEDKTKRMIEILDNYKGSKGKKYASDYRAILNWVVERVEEEEQKGGNRQAKPFNGGQAASQKHDAGSQAQASPNGGAVANRGSDQQDRQEGERRGLPGDSQRSAGSSSKYDIFVRR